jgi:hypothetical protein
MPISFISSGEKKISTVETNKAMDRKIKRKGWVHIVISSKRFDFDDTRQVIKTPLSLGEFSAVRVDRAELFVCQGNQSGMCLLRGNTL